MAWSTGRGGTPLKVTAGVSAGNHHLQHGVAVAASLPRQDELHEDVLRGVLRAPAVHHQDHARVS
eukprot:9360272-Pyramimonas_sp.AAC.1